jgi:hypothetical protein
MKAGRGRERFAKNARSDAIAAQMNPDEKMNNEDAKTQRL